ncbi:MAG: hypothetical protein GY950_30180 [bacterium]|nr:hypothetical protein [bacterium]
MNGKRFILFAITFLLLMPAASAETNQQRQSTPFAQTKFIPNISFILDFSYVRRNIENGIFDELEIPGFLHGGSHEHDGHAHASANAKNGFNLNYGELVLAAAVDPYFDLFTSFHLTEDSFEMEEAYVETRRLPLGFRVKLGKFFSGFGRLNARHAHLWDFSDIPLVYRVFFGEEGLLEKGIQLNWTAPTDFYLALGVETLQGTNESSFGVGEFHLVAEDTGTEMEIGEPPLPNLWNVFAKTSVDVGDFVVLAGVSYAMGKFRTDHFEDEEEPHGFAGDTRLLGIDLTAKYIIDSYRYLAFEMEYMYRHRDGMRYGVHQDAQGHEGEEHHEDEHGAYEVDTAAMETKQAGLYAQLVYRFHKLWRFGARWDLLHQNDIRVESDSLNLPAKLNRYGFMVDFSPTEFSRIRLQYNINRYAFFEEERKDYHEFFFQFNFAVGAHGAHPF